MSRLATLLLLISVTAARATTLQLLINNPPGSATDRGARVLQAEVLRRSHGRLKIEVHPSAIWKGRHLGELGELQVVSSGEVAITIVTSAPLVNFDPAFQLLNAPFLFDSYAQADRVLDGPAGLQLLASLPAHGLRGLAFWDAGFRVLALTRPWHGLHGQRVRVMESPLTLAVMQAMGAIPVPADIERVQSMLSAGYIDAVDTSYPPFVEYRMYQASHYILESRHSYAAKVVVINNAAYQRLSPAEQQWLSQAAMQTRFQERQFFRDDEQRTRRQCKTLGVQLVPLAAADRQTMLQACRPVYDALQRQFTEPWEQALLAIRQR